MPQFFYIYISLEARLPFNIKQCLSFCPGDFYSEWSEHEMMQGDTCMVNLNWEVCRCCLLSRSPSPWFQCSLLSSCPVFALVYSADFRIIYVIWINVVRMLTDSWSEKHWLSRYSAKSCWKSLEPGIHQDANWPSCRPRTSSNFQRSWSDWAFMRRAWRLRSIEVPLWIRLGSWLLGRFWKLCCGDLCNVTAVTKRVSMNDKSVN